MLFTVLFMRLHGFHNEIAPPLYGQCHVGRRIVHDEIEKPLEREPEQSEHREYGQLHACDLPPMLYALVRLVRLTVVFVVAFADIVMVEGVLDLLGFPRALMDLRDTELRVVLVGTHGTEDVFVVESRDDRTRKGYQAGVADDRQLGNDRKELIPYLDTSHADRNEPSSCSDEVDCIHSYFHCENEAIIADRVTANTRSKVGDLPMLFNRHTSGARGKAGTNRVQKANWIIISMYSSATPSSSGSFSR